MDDDFLDRCCELYLKIFADYHLNRGFSETIARKKTIEDVFKELSSERKDKTSAEIWREIQKAHMQTKSGESDLEKIKKIISASQSWNKTSGHAFEEMICNLGSKALEDTDIKIVLQRDLTVLLKKNELFNSKEDLDWLESKKDGDVFDAYALCNRNGKLCCFGCIQSKTSIRDRVTRDREPSIEAMNNNFWSIVLVLDDGFLKGKFIEMVNGGGKQYDTPGWHGLYVMGGKESYKPEGTNRIYHTDLDMEIFREHAINASQFWKNERVQMRVDWTAEKVLR